MYNVLVIGDNPDDLMKKYQRDLQVPKYIKFKFSDAEQMKKNTLNIYKEFTTADNLTLPAFQIATLKERIEEIESMTLFDYYISATQGLELDDDGNAWSTENPNGQWGNYQIGTKFVSPFILYNGNSAFQATKGEINWSAMHRSNTELYNRVWELLVDHESIQNETDQKIYDNRHALLQVIEEFETKDDYVKYNTSYWNFAVLNTNDWVDMDNKDSKEWVNNFYDTYIANLPDDTLLTVYEFERF